MVAKDFHGSLSTATVDQTDHASSRYRGLADKPLFYTGKMIEGDLY